MPLPQGDMTYLNKRAAKPNRYNKTCDKLYAADMQHMHIVKCQIGQQQVPDL